MGNRGLRIDETTSQEPILMVRGRQSRKTPLPALMRSAGCCLMLFVAAGCSQAPFCRLTEDVPAGTAPAEKKISVGRETRSVLSAPYRSEPREVRVSTDGTVRLGAVGDIEELSTDAVGIRIRVQQPPALLEGVVKNEALGYAYIPLPPNRDASVIAERRARVLPSGQDLTKVTAWAREVFPLPREHVTEITRVPRSARLDFGIALEGDEPDPDSPPIKFTVFVERGTTREVIFSRTLSSESMADATGWTDASVDLSRLAGTQVSFVFRTESVLDESADGARSGTLSFNSPVWSSPILHSTRTSRSLTTPNVVLISLDTLRADHLGCYGYHRSTSPNIDAFSEEAFLFEKAVAPSSWTLPSHASLFTGLHPVAHGAVSYPWVPVSVVFPGIPCIRNSEITLAELAREHGYMTAAYTEGVLVRAALGFSQGFDIYSDGEPTYHEMAETTFGKALAWVQTYKQLPFFLFIHTYEIHAPYSPPKRFAAMFDKEYGGPVGTRIEMCYPKVEGWSEADRTHIEALYDGEIAYTDEVVGDFLGQLRRMGLLDNTVVIILSDHGEEFYEHGGVEHWKTLYDEVLHVPLIMRLPGANPPAGRVSRQVSLTDVYATVAELLAINRDMPPDCMSLLPLMGMSKSGEHYTRTVVVSDLNELNREKLAQDPMRAWWRMQSVRTGEEKYIKSEKKQVEELFDLREDPGEQNDIAVDNQARLAEYRASLAAFIKSVTAGRSQAPADAWRTPILTEEDRRRLKALAYD